MDRHVANAFRVAEWLEGHPAVDRVRFAGLDSSPYRALARRYLPLGAGSIFAFDLAGGRDQARAFVEGLRVWSHLANVEHARYLGRMHWLGFNTGEITSSRTHG